MYDYLIVGAGLYGATVANKLAKQGKKVIVVEKRPHIAGNCYSEVVHNINVQKYGAHIFHTSNEEVWKFVNTYAKFNNYVHNVLANFNGEIYHLPFNMNTFKEIYGVTDPEEAKKLLQEEIKKVYTENPKNLKEQALNLVGEKIFKILIEGYTEKQWNKKCEELPPFIIKRLPVRYEYNNDYFSDKYSGIPIGGFTKLIENILEGIEVKCNYDYLKHKNEIPCKKIIFTGPIDEYFDYCYGPLEYRSLRFEDEILKQEKFQEKSVVNYTDSKTPYTRIIEHKHFDDAKSDYTVITREYPSDWKQGMEAYYPVNDEKNNILYQKYLDLAKKDGNVYFGGRLGMYRYFNMDVVIAKALEDVENKVF